MLTHVHKVLHLVVSTFVEMKCIFYIMLEASVGEVARVFFIENTH